MYQEFMEIFKNIKVNFNTVISLWNIMKLDEVMINNLKEFGPIYAESTLHFSIGQKDDIRMLPKPLKVMVEEKVSGLIKYLFQNGIPLKTIINIKRIIEFMKSSDLSNEWPEFVNWCRKLDMSRGQNILQHIPEYAPFMGNSKVFDVGGRSFS